MNKLDALTLRLPLPSCTQFVPLFLHCSRMPRSGFSTRGSMGWISVCSCPRAAWN